MQYGFTCDQSRVKNGFFLKASFRRMMHYSDYTKTGGRRDIALKNYGCMNNFICFGSEYEIFCGRALFEPPR